RGVSRPLGASGDGHARRGVAKAFGGAGESGEAFGGRRRGDQEDGGNVILVARGAPFLRFLQGEVRHDRTRDAALGEPPARPAKSVVVKQVVVGHHYQRGSEVT